MKKPGKRSQKNYAAKYRRLRRAYFKKEIELRDLKEDLFRLFESTGEGVFLVDLEGRLRLFNTEAQRITGYRRNEVLDRHVRVLLTLDDLADGFKFLHEILKGQYTQPQLFRIRKRDHSTTIVEIHGCPFYMCGRLTGALGFFRDIRERKREEEENQPQVQAFKDLDGSLEVWSNEIRSLRQEVNDLLRSFGRQAKYPLE